MKKWRTKIKAIDPKDGKLKNWDGPVVPGITIQDAITYCQSNELGYCIVDAEIIKEIPCKEETYEPDFDNMIDYENIQNN